VAPNSLPTFVKFGISPAALVITLFVRAHVSNFWKGKAKVPFVDGYVRKDSFPSSKIQNTDALKE